MKKLAVNGWSELVKVASWIDTLANINSVVLML